jgi:hypothetical protein
MKAIRNCILSLDEESVKVRAVPALLLGCRHFDHLSVWQKAKVMCLAHECIQQVVRDRQFLHLRLCMVIGFSQSFNEGGVALDLLEQSGAENPVVDQLRACSDLTIKQASHHVLNSMDYRFDPSGPAQTFDVQHPLLSFLALTKQPPLNVQNPLLQVRTFSWTLPRRSLKGRYFRTFQLFSRASYCESMLEAQRSLQVTKSP